MADEKIQEPLNTAKKYIEDAIGTIKHDGHLGSIQTDLILPDLEKALAEIGTIWHSDKEFQQLLEQNAKLTRENNIVNQLDHINSKLESQIIDLKSQLQQQELPVVPEDVDKAIKYLKTQNNFATLSDFDDILTEKGFWWLNDFQFKDRRFGFGGLNNKLFILSHLAITGYTVEKPQDKITKEIK